MKLQAKAYPNPFNTNLSVEVISDADSQVIFRLYNQLGNLIKMSYWKLLKGNNKIMLDNLQNLAMGLYTIELKDENNHVLHKFELVKS
jgi:type IX secretion system substrate protein